MGVVNHDLVRIDLDQHREMAEVGIGVEPMVQDNAGPSPGEPLQQTDWGGGLKHDRRQPLLKGIQSQPMSPAGADMRPNMFGDAIPDLSLPAIQPERPIDHRQSRRSAGAAPLDDPLSLVGNAKCTHELIFADQGVFGNPRESWSLGTRVHFEPKKPRRPITPHAG